MFHSKSKQKSSAEKRVANNKLRPAVLIFSVVLLIVVAVSGTLAYLSDSEEPIINAFTPADITCTVTENFENNVKSNVNAQNTGSADAYVRIKLVTYRENENGQHIGGIAAIPEFTPGENWVEHNGYYYYTLTVAPGDSPEVPLIGDDGIALEGNYIDADGGKQVIEVMAEAIQADTNQAVTRTVIGEAWGVVIAENSVTNYVA